MAVDRRWFVLALVTFALVMLPGVANACDDPTIGLPDGAGRGDAVSFTIANIEDGAWFRVSVGGRVVAEGHDNDGGQGYRGTFAMPDFGSESREVPVDAIVEHEGSYPVTGDLSMRYHAPAPARPKRDDAQPREQTDDRAVDRDRPSSGAAERAHDSRGPAAAQPVARPGGEPRAEQARAEQAKAEQQARRAGADERGERDTAGKASEGGVEIPRRLLLEAPAVDAGDAVGTRAAAAADETEPWTLIARATLLVLIALALLARRVVPRRMRPGAVVALNERDEEQRAA